MLRFWKLYSYEEKERARVSFHHEILAQNLRAYNESYNIKTVYISITEEIEKRPVLGVLSALKNG